VPGTVEGGADLLRPAGIAAAAPGEPREGRDREKEASDPRAGSHPEARDLQPSYRQKSRRFMEELLTDPPFVHDGGDASCGDA
jgi:hypothetical protein